ncbi:hypothetical protein DL93DRAFT_2174376 [Clavulina sp. PMI_390]|nr:hypothetical protein DL93DRAFT_2174376 [Clavulina sp. PMI_390]
MGGGTPSPTSQSPPTSAQRPTPLLLPSNNHLPAYYLLPHHHSQRAQCPSALLRPCASFPATTTTPNDYDHATTLNACSRPEPSNLRRPQHFSLPPAPLQ